MPRLAAYLGGLLVVLVSISTARAEPACEVQPLGTLGGLGTTTRDMNDSGQIVGSSDATVDRPDRVIHHAFIWENGSIRDLGALADDAQSQAMAINALGVIVGSSTLVPRGRDQPVIWQDEVIAPLPFDGEEGEALDINGNGQIIGRSGDSTCLLWQDANSDPIELEGLGGDFCRPSAINDDGVIVGRASTADGEQRAFFFRNGVLRAAEALAHARSEASHLRAINAFGLAVGTFGTDENPRAFVWTRRGGGRLLDVADAVPRTVNDFDVIALIPTSRPFTLLLGDRHGRTLELGDGLNGPEDPEPFKYVTGLAVNNLFRAAWNVYTTGTEYDHAYTCQLPQRTAIQFALESALGDLVSRIGAELP